MTYMKRMIARDRAQLDGTPMLAIGGKQNFLRIVDRGQ